MSEVIQSTTSSCPICSGELNNPVDTNCSHTFCAQGHDGDCPLCKQNWCSDELSRSQSQQHTQYDQNAQGLDTRAQPIGIKLFSLMLILTLLMSCIIGGAFFRDYERFWV